MIGHGREHPRQSRRLRVLPGRGCAVEPSAVPEKLTEMVLHCLVIHFENVVMNDLSFRTRKCIS